MKKLQIGDLWMFREIDDIYLSWDKPEWSDEYDEFLTDGQDLPIFIGTFNVPELGHGECCKIGIYKEE